MIQYIKTYLSGPNQEQNLSGQSAAWLGTRNVNFNECVKHIVCQMTLYYKPAITHRATKEKTRFK